VYRTIVGPDNKLKEQFLPMLHDLQITPQDIQDL
jgi:hypothetical protein